MTTRNIPWKPNTDLSVVGLQGKDNVRPAKLGSQEIGISILTPNYKLRNYGKR